VAAIIGVDKLLRIDLDATQGPVSFVRQALDRLPEAKSKAISVGRAAQDDWQWGHRIILGRKRWNRRWLYDTLRLFNGYRVRRDMLKVAPAG